jgi:cation:H+ antiporter
MSTVQPGRTRDDWQRKLLVAAACAALGVAVHLAGPLIPVQLAVIGLGIGVVAAAFMLAWAADAGDAIFTGGIVLAGVALVAVLPEFVIEVRFAFIQQAELVTANLTGATRLLLTGALALPLLVAVHGRRRGQVTTQIRLEPNRKLELGMLLVASLYSIQVLVRGSLTVVDGILLIAMYVLYARRVQGTADEEAAVVGVAAGLVSLPERYRRTAITALTAAAGAVVLLIANPFADALLHTGELLGIDPYLMIQSVVPAATEAPEFVVVAVLVANQRPAQGLALFLASSLSQWTLGIGALPIAYSIGGGGLAMPLAGREQVELGLTIAVTGFTVAALATLRWVKADALLLISLFVAQLVLPFTVVRVSVGFVLLVFALDLSLEHRSSLGGILRTGIRGAKAPNGTSRG